MPDLGDQIGRAHDRVARAPDHGVAELPMQDHMQRDGRDAGPVTPDRGIEIGVRAQQCNEPHSSTGEAMRHRLAAGLRGEPAAERIMTGQAERYGKWLAGFENYIRQVGDARAQIGNMTGAGAKDDPICRKSGPQDPQILLIKGEMHGLVADEIEKRDVAETARH